MTKFLVRLIARAIEDRLFSMNQRISEMDEFQNAELKHVNNRLDFIQQLVQKEIENAKVNTKKNI